MSYYGHKPVSRAAPTVGADYFSPGYVLAEMNGIEASVQALTRDIAASAIDADFKADFALFAQDWRAFYGAFNKPVVDWLPRAVNSTRDKVLEFKNTVADWRDAFVKRGGKPSPVALRRANTFSIVPYLVGGAIAFGAIYLIFNKGDDNE